MKLFLLLLCFVAACSTARVEPVVQNNAPEPTRKQIQTELLSREIDRASLMAGLVLLKTAKVGEGEAEIRVWYGFGLFALEGFVIKRTNDELAAFHLKADHHSTHYAKQVSRIKLPTPKSGWVSCWQRLVDAGIFTLPGGTEGPDPDAQGFYVEVNNAGSYRNYEYTSPEYSESPNAKRMLVIGEIISDEFGLARFHRRPVK
jgi:hypothetical protein